MPLTFCLELDSDRFLQDYERFQSIFYYLAQQPVNEEGKPIVPLSQRDETMVKNTHFAGFNLWLLKPTGLNRGRGIHVFDTIERLKKLLKECMDGTPTTAPGGEQIANPLTKIDPPVTTTAFGAAFSSG